MNLRILVIVIASCLFSGAMTWAQTESRWLVGNGSWQDPNNCIFCVPNAPDAVALFSSGDSLARTITVISPVTV
ncbi:MAG: hypothetical protein KDA87_14635, partial [Planctomycetales bacterium]|nr:hypothetical protein [Planctomycetales bacterium]